MWAVSSTGYNKHLRIIQSMRIYRGNSKLLRIVGNSSNGTWLHNLQDTTQHNDHRGNLKFLDGEGRDIIYAKIFSCFPQFLKAESEMIIRLSQVRFFPNLFQIILHLPSQNLTPYSQATDSVIKYYPPKRRVCRKTAPSHLSLFCENNSI
jgi:hypothetical protein